MALDTPAPTLTVKVLGADNALAPTTLFMSFGLLMELVGIAKNVNGILVLDLDPEIIRRFFNMMFVPRDPNGKPTVEDFEHPEMPIDQAELVLDFGKDHLSTYFMRRLTHSMKVGQAIGGLLRERTEVESSLTGSTG